jgi:hypothetical protein
MTPWIALSCSCFVVLAGLHSALGERFLLKPLFRSDAFAGLEIGKSYGARIFRFAWHLTSISWIALAALVALIPDSRAIIAVLAAVSGLYVLLASRGRHLAWPVFLLGAVGSARGIGLFAQAAGPIGAALGVLLGAIAVLHLYWALGGKAGLAAVVPTKGDQKLIDPGPIASVVVMLGLFGLAALALTLGGFIDPLVSSAIARGAAALAGCVFLVRAYGDFRSVGVLKRIRGTTFSRWDDRLYTPLCFGLSVGFFLLFDVGAR